MNASNRSYSQLAYPIAMTAIPHAPRKQARQARARATQTAIIEAAARILEGNGRDGLTTNRVADRAGVSIGSLYQYFPNKEAIVAALLRREREALLSRIREISAAANDPMAAVSALVDAAMEHQFARPKLALELEYLEASLGIEAEAAELSQQVAEEILAVVRMLKPEADLCIARDAVAICKAIANSAALSGKAEQAKISARLHKAVLGYLR